MDEIKQQRKELDELHFLLNSFNIFLDSLPAGIVKMDIQSLMDNIKYVRGYVDCMIANHIVANIS